MASELLGRRHLAQVDPLQSREIGSAVAVRAEFESYSSPSSLEASFVLFRNSCTAREQPATAARRWNPRRRLSRTLPRASRRSFDAEEPGPTLCSHSRRARAATRIAKHLAKPRHTRAQHQIASVLMCASQSLQYRVAHPQTCSSGARDAAADSQRRMPTRGEAAAPRSRCLALATPTDLCHCLRLQVRRSAPETPAALSRQPHRADRERQPHRADRERQPHRADRERQPHRADQVKNAPSAPSGRSRTTSGPKAANSRGNPQACAASCGVAIVAIRLKLGILPARRGKPTTHTRVIEKGIGECSSCFLQPKVPADPANLLRRSNRTRPSWF